MPIPSAYRLQTPASTRMTAYLIGVDEAGYGPNLGPLVIGATAWRVEANDGGRGTGDGGRAQHTRRRPNPAHGSNTLTRVAPAEMDLYQALSPLVTPYWEDDCLPIADSKRLYAPPLGLGRLERGVHSALRLLGHQPRKWNDLVELLGADPENKRRDLPWHDDYE